MDEWSPVKMRWFTTKSKAREIKIKRRNGSTVECRVIACWKGCVMIAGAETLIWTIRSSGPWHFIVHRCWQGLFLSLFFLSLRLQLLPSSLTCLVFKWGNLCRPPARLLALGRCRALHGPKRSGALSSWERTGTKGEKGCCFAQGTYLVRVYTYLKQLKRERGWERGGGVQVCLIGLKCQINQQKIKE